MTQYYSNATTTDFNVLSGWGINTDGTGANPAQFATHDFTQKHAKTLSAAVSVNGFKLDSGFTLTGAGFKITTTGELGGRAIYLDGTVSGFLDLEIQTNTTTIVNAGSKARDITINHTDCIALWEGNHTFRNITVTLGKFEPETGITDTLTATGDVSVTETLGIATWTGAATFGSLTINSGGTYNATSGTTTIKSATGTSSNTLSNSGTFTHNNGKLYFDLSVANGDGYHNILNSSTAGLHTFYDFEIKCDAEYVAMMKSIEVLGNYTVSGANAIRYESGNNTKTIIVHGLATTSNGQLGSADTTGLDTTIPLEKRGWQFLGGLDVTGGTLKLGSNQTVKVSGLRNIGGTIT